MSISECSTEPSSRLECVKLEYKQFLAARIIQKHIRGWLYRVISRRQNWAATTISRWWRGYWVRHNRFAVIEAQLQQSLIDYYNHMATKVQSLFRGWQTRKECQDFEGMKQLRIQYAEDMVSTLAKVLHKMRKASLLPGIYGLRGSGLMKKIEGLSFTFGYRFHNGRVRAAIAQRRAKLARQRHDFQKALLYTMGPFPGPDVPFELAPDFNVGKRIGTQQQRVYLLYDKASRDRHFKDMQLKVSARLRETMAHTREEIRSRFCRDLVKRAIQDAFHLPSHYRFSGMIQNFMEDLIYILEEHNCYCQPKIDDTWCN
ncbi:hypothetical protein KR032_011176 [Drosophila birchii]|nr:hypothetical protein KR032_011176 [Drosophila birchii]